MLEYRLYTVVPRLLQFLDGLTNLYIRLNRPRLKVSVSEIFTYIIGSIRKRGHIDGPQHPFRCTLHFCANNGIFLKCFAVNFQSSFAPFMSESIYMRLKPFLPPSLLEGHTESVHFLLFPEVKEKFFDEAIQRKVRRMTTVLDLTRYLRESRSLNFKVDQYISRSNEVGAITRNRRRP